MRILYGVNPIGLGHATRAVAIGEELKERGEVWFATGGSALELIRSHGYKVEDAITEPVPRVVNGEMKDASLWYVRYWLGYRRSKRMMAELMDALSPDLVVGDEEFSGLELARERKMRHALISDELDLGFARSWLAKKIEARAEAWYKALVRSVDLLIVPDDGADAENIRHVGPIVRKPTRSRTDVRAGLAIPEGSGMILLSLSGAGISRNLISPVLDWVKQEEGVELVITGNRGRRMVGERIHDAGFLMDNQNLVAAADLVISTAGKSTIDEALAFGTPMIAIPTKNHAEQERNALALGYSPADGDRLGELISQKLGRRTTPRWPDGARRTAELLLSAASQ